MKIVLISTYELGRQPFGLASPAAWLRSAGHEVVCADLAVGTLPALPVREAGLVGFYLPMHTATRLAVPVIERVRTLNPRARLCCYGLYAPVNDDYLRSLGVEAVVGGEFEAELLRIANGGTVNGTLVPLDRLTFIAPDRTGLPVLARYPKLVTKEGKRRAGYTEATRGCKHLCRHCPVVPVYNGAFRVVAVDIVLADIRQQVAGGAEHISFGDPDFFNGPAHARRIVEALHSEFPRLTYDVTIKVEHLLKHRELLPVLRETGCVFVISAVECVDDAVLARLDKGHTRADFFEAVRLLRENGLTLSPTFIPFHPWTTAASYAELLTTIRELDLIDNVAPVQLSLRLLIPSGSRLLELDDIRAAVEGYDPASLVWRWRNPDPSVDELARGVLHIVHDGTKRDASRRAVFGEIEARVHGQRPPEDLRLLPRTVIPYMEEPWFC